VGRMGQEYGLVSVFNKKYPAGSLLRCPCPTPTENGGYDREGGLTSLRLRCITSSPSQTRRRRLVRTTDDGRCGKCSTLAAVRRGLIFLHFATRTVDNTVCSEARYSSRIAFFAYPTWATCIRRPSYGGYRRNIATPFGTEKLEWCGYPMVKICLFVLT